MKREYRTFVNEVLKHGDQARAYGKAYPTSKASTHRSAAARLMHRPEIDAAINDYLQELRAELEAEIRADMKEQLAAEMDYKIMLSKIIRQQVKLEREVKGANNQPLVLRSDPGFAQMIKAGLVLGAMEGWNMGSLGKQGGRADKSRSFGEKEQILPDGERLQTDIPEMTEEEKDAQRRKGKCINYTYKRVSEYYEQYERNNGYRDEHYEKDKQFFLQRALEQDRRKEQMAGAAGSSGTEGGSNWQPKGGNQGFDSKQTQFVNTFEKTLNCEQTQFVNTFEKTLNCEQTQFVNTFEKTLNCEQTQFVNTFEKTLNCEQNETKSSTTASQTSSSDNSKNINKSMEIVRPKRYIGSDDLKANGYMSLQEKLKKYEGEAIRNMGIREKVPGFPVGDDERTYKKYELMKNALLLPPEVCSKVFESLGYELYAYDNNWFRHKR